MSDPWYVGTAHLQATSSSLQNSYKCTKVCVQVPCRIVQKSENTGNNSNAHQDAIAKSRFIHTVDYYTAVERWGMWAQLLKDVCHLSLSAQHDSSLVKAPPPKLSSQLWVAETKATKKSHSSVHGDRLQGLGLQGRRRDAHSIYFCIV